MYAQFCETEPTGPGPPFRRAWRPRGELVCLAPSALMAKHGKSALKVTFKRVRQKSPDPAYAGLGRDYFNSEIDWPVCKAEYESLVPENQVRCEACHMDDKAIIQFKVKQVIGMASQGGFLEATCTNDGGFTQATLDFTGLRGRGVVHICSGAASRCRATWGTRHVFHASKWRVMDIAEYGEADDEIFGDTGVEVPRPAASIFDKDGDLQAGRASAPDGDEGDRDFGGADPEMLKAKLESPKASLGGHLPEVLADSEVPSGSSSSTTFGTSGEE